MKTYVFPADTTGCGCYRLIWPAEQLKRDGYNVEVVLPSEREKMLQGIMNNDKLVNVRMPSDADVIVFQRVTHRLIADAITIILRRASPSSSIWTMISRASIPLTPRSTHFIRR